MPGQASRRGAAAESCFRRIRKCLVPAVAGGLSSLGLAGDIRLRMRVTQFDGVSAPLCRRAGMPVWPRGDIYNRLADCTRTTCEIFEHMGTILLIIVVLLLIGALPRWPYSSGWGYYPSGGLGLLLLILIILLILRYI